MPEVFYINTVEASTKEPQLLSCSLYVDSKQKIPFLSLYPFELTNSLVVICLIVDTNSNAIERLLSYTFCANNLKENLSLRIQVSTTTVGTNSCTGTYQASLHDPITLLVRA